MPTFNRTNQKSLLNITGPASKRVVCIHCALTQWSASQTPYVARIGENNKIVLSFSTLSDPIWREDILPTYEQTNRLSF